MIRSSRAVGLFLLAACIVLPAAFALPPDSWPSGPAVISARTVVVGDVHGDAAGLGRILRTAGLLDEAGGWRGGDSELVLTGDLVDRGAASREVLDLVMRLQRQAPDRVHVLLGNHEVMSLMGDWRYVAPEEYRAWAGPGSEALRESRWKSWVEFERARARRLGFDEPRADETRRAGWMAAHPPGFFERRRALAAGGPYGTWLRGLDAVRLSGGVLYVHGGLSDRRPFPSVDSLNARVHDEIARLDELSSSLSEAGVLWPDATWGEALALAREELDLWEAVDSLPPDRVDEAARALRPSDETLGRMRELLAVPGWAIADSLGPLWYRGLASEPDAALGPEVREVLERYGAEHVVAGHTPTRDSRIHVRLDGRVFLIDTGLSAAMGGRPSALEIRAGRFVALYVDEEPVAVWPATGPAASTSRQAAPASKARPAVSPLTEPRSGPAPLHRGDLIAHASESRLTPKVAGAPARMRTLASPSRSDALVEAAWSSAPWGQAEPIWPDTPLVGGYDGLRGLAASDVERFLQGAKIVRVREIGEGVTKPLRATLEDGPLRHDAAIQSVDACRDSMPPGQLLPIPVCDSYKYNLAAYEIGKLLGLSSIPPCVAREYRGRKAAFTWWIDEAMTLTKMREKHLRPPDMASWNTQQFTIGIFDELIFNIDRNQGNLLVDPAWRVWMIDHTRAFRTGLALRNPVLLSRMKLDSALREHLQGLTGADLERCCREYLAREERDALLARRDSILARLR